MWGKFVHIELGLFVFKYAVNTLCQGVNVAVPNLSLSLNFVRRVQLPKDGTCKTFNLDTCTWNPGHGISLPKSSLLEDVWCTYIQLLHLINTDYNC